jgi:hypothetical protein
MNRKAGIIISNVNSASQKKGSTIFMSEDTDENESTMDKIRKSEKETAKDVEGELHIPEEDAVKFEKKNNKEALREYEDTVSPTPISIVKEVATTEEEIEMAKKRMDNLIEGSDVVLLKLKSTFPFELFPDEMTVDIHKVSLISREFFWSERVHSVMIEDISDVFIETSPFFATLNVVDKNFVETLVKISYLKKDEAARARRILQGLIIAKQQTMDVTHINPGELIPRLEELGKAM